MCIECLIGYHWDCLFPTADDCCCALLKQAPVDSFDEKKDRGGQVKSSDAITDIESTGRKRAAMIYPDLEGLPCGWRGLFAAGGGVVPIVGCLVGEAKHRHHGPDKNTVNNGPNNLHVVCHDCHNRWHTLNDSYYPEIRPATNTPFVPLVEYVPHDATTQATEIEVIFSDNWFKSKKKTETYAELRENFEKQRLGTNALDKGIPDGV